MLNYRPRNTREGLKTPSTCCPGPNRDDVPDEQNIYDRIRQIGPWRKNSICTRRTSPAFPHHLRRLRIIRFHSVLTGVCWNGWSVRPKFVGPRIGAKISSGTPAPLFLPIFGDLATHSELLLLCWTRCCRPSSCCCCLPGARRQAAQGRHWPKRGSSTSRV